MKDNRLAILVEDLAYRIGIWEQGLEQEASSNYSSEKQLFLSLLSASDGNWLSDYALLHITRYHDYRELSRIVETADSNGMRFVLTSASPLCEREFYQNLAASFKEYYNDSDLIWRIRRSWDVYDSSRKGIDELFIDVAYMADLILCNSVATAEALKQGGLGSKCVFQRYPAIRNEPKTVAAPQILKEVGKYALCIGDIEPGNNQALAAWGIAGDLALVLIGKIVDSDYAKLIRHLSNDKAIFVEDAEFEELEAAICCASIYCHCAPFRFARGAWQASQRGIPLIISRTLAHFLPTGDFHGFDPTDPGSFKEAFAEMVGKQPGSAFASPCSYLPGGYVLKILADVYRELLYVPKNIYSISSFIYIDLTTSAGADVINGIPRTEVEIARYFKNKYGDRVKFIVFNGQLCQFVSISASDFINGEYRHKYREGGHYTDPALVENGSTIIIAGNTVLSNKAYVSTLRGFKRDKEVFLSIFIYDLITVSLPHLYPFHAIRDGYAYERILRIADFIFTISRSTLKLLNEFAAERGVKLPATGILRLGDNIGADNDETSNLLPILEALRGAPFILMVSGFAYRKNHRLIYHVYREIVAENPNAPHLVCIGGWEDGNPYIYMMQLDPALMGHLHIFHEIDDSQLEWLYANCLFTLYPSLHEGWGLPVAESLVHGKICIASNATSIPEIAPNLTDLLDPLDFVAWKNTILFYYRDNKARQFRENQIAGYKQHSWEKAGAEADALLARGGDSKNVLRLIESGSRISFTLAKQQFADEFLGGGWGEPENDGVWTTAGQATIHLRIHRDAHPSGIIMCCVGFNANNAGNIINVTVNDLQVYENLEICQECRLIIPLPQRENGGSSIWNNLVIRVFVINSRRPCDVLAKSTDKRSLGIKLKYIERFFLNYEQQQIEKSICRIEQHMPGFGAITRTLLHKYPNLVHLLQDNSDGVSLLLWCFQIGKKKLNIIRDDKERIKSALCALHSRAGEDSHTSGYTQLMNGIWHNRPDLQFISNVTPEGQARICRWFYDFGMKEYDLMDVLSTKSPASGGNA